MLLSTLGNPLLHGEGESGVGLQERQPCFLLPDLPRGLVIIAWVY